MHNKLGGKKLFIMGMKKPTSMIQGGRTKSGIW